MKKQTEKDKITVLYERLSHDDERAGESVSIENHDKIFLSSGRRPFFDFAVFSTGGELLFLIEYHGKQHYGFSGKGWDNEENYLATVRRDFEKREACASMGIPLYEINEKDLKYLHELLKSILDCHPSAITDLDLEGEGGAG